MTWIGVIDTDVLITRGGPVGIVTINRPLRRARSSGKRAALVISSPVAPVNCHHGVVTSRVRYCWQHETTGDKSIEVSIGFSDARQRFGTRPRGLQIRQLMRVQRPPVDRFGFVFIRSASAAPVVAP